MFELATLILSHLTQKETNSTTKLNEYCIQSYVLYVFDTFTHTPCDKSKECPIKYSL